MAAIRLSVRELVSYSYFQPDILPNAYALMEQGRAAHLMRQQHSGAQREQPLRWEGRKQGLCFVITGRMDLLDASQQPPLIEEIKLCGQELPLQPQPEHLQQALCYGYMHCLNQGLEAACIRVSYADVAGGLRASFDQVYAFDQLQQAFAALLSAYASWQKRLLRHRQRRDHSIGQLAFPYPDYRPGQREMAAQVYTAILRKKRLFAMMPTGSGKSAAVLYPALKALGLQHTRQIFCLTARGTAQLAMQQELARMRKAGLRLKAFSMVAKEKLCPYPEPRCEPAHCARASGHFLRQRDALSAALRSPQWDERAIRRLSQRYQLCPFEFSLALSEIADVVIGDYNYAFDPRVSIKRIFDQIGQVTVLLDEAHNLPERARDMLSGQLSGRQLALFRRELGRRFGHRGGLYPPLSKLIAAMRDMAEGSEQLQPLLEAAEGLMQALREQPQVAVPTQLMRDMLGFVDALRRQAADPAAYRLLVGEEGKDKLLQLLCLDFTPFLRQAGARFQGFVCYSATLQPLSAMRDLLGGDREDACFELPSPFPKEHLLALQLPVNTRYAKRGQSLPELAEAIRAMFAGRPGKYIAFFPSYSYMRQAAELLAGLPLHIQQGGMDEAARLAYLARFSADEEPLLGLCVLGGLFAEGIDLPGQRLIGVCVVGVGLPQLSARQEAIRARADAQGLSGFDIAYRFPGMHKVLQAAGRLIRSDSDRGVLLLCDDRFGQGVYRALLPQHIEPLALKKAAEIGPALQEFWLR